MSKVFCIGLDGATFDLIRPFIAQGKLPTFKKLMDGGAWSELESTIPPVTASAWSSFMTGKNPGAHGLFDFMQRKRDSYDLAPVSARDRDGKAVWDLIGDANKKVIVMNVPVTWPPQSVNGLLITGMLTPRGATEFTYPRELADELRAQIGEYIVYSDEVYSKGRGEIFLSALKYSAEQRTRAAECLMEKYPWDFFMLVFPETDTVCHGLWSAYDATHHQHDQREAEKFRDGILEIYQHIDSQIARLLNVIASEAKQSPSRIMGIASQTALAMTETTVMLMSDHGHGPLRNFLYVNNFLAKYGFLKFKNNPLTLLKRAAFALGITPRAVYQLLLAFGLGKLRRTLDKRRGGRGLLKKFFLSLNDVDWSRTRAYSIGYIGEVHINLRGREPQGIVAPGEEYERVRDDVINRLRELKLSDSVPLIEKIWKKEEIYRGAHLADAPDILFLPRNLETIAFGDFEFGSNKIIEPSYGVSSSHRMNGIFVASGAGVKNAGEFKDARLIDLAPTILHALQLPVPRDMDGRVLSEIFSDARAVEFGGTSEGKNATEGYSEEEEQQVIERLKDLGYIS
ncbi:MAG: alkaline phosphatase family protein [Chloroflexi bacterium]|nr:alkaline phosphatase family protein [Chloroflexota bacterium]